MEYTDIPWYLPTLAIVGFFFVAIIVACKLEKRLIQPYYVPEDGDQYKLLPGAVRNNREAKDHTFRRVALCHDAKGKMYKVRYDFWLSPDRTTIAEIGSGKIAAMTVNAVWFYSRTTDGGVLCTTSANGDEDISGLIQHVTWTKYKFAALLQKHQQRLDRVTPAKFSGDDPLEGFFDILAEKAEALVAKGYASYIDEDRTAWRYTWKGAFTFYFVGVWGRPIRRMFRSIGLVKD